MSSCSKYQISRPISPILVQFASKTDYFDTGFIRSPFFQFEKWAHVQIIKFLNQFHQFWFKLGQNWLFWHQVHSIPLLSIRKMSSYSNCQNTQPISPILQSIQTKIGYFDTRPIRSHFSQFEKWAHVQNSEFFDQLHQFWLTNSHGWNNQWLNERH